MTLAVVTGVSRGIGREVALSLAKRGIRLAVLGRPSAAHDDTVAACEYDVTVTSIACDMGVREQVEHAGKTLVDELGAPDIVIHNAAMLERGHRIHELSPDAWNRLLAVNLTGPFLLTHTLLPAMLANKRGRFLFVSSVSGTIGCPEMAHYGASKWGLIGLAKALSEELRDTPLLSLAILPGSVDTDMLKKTPFEPDMTAREVADVIVYYALDAPPAVAGASVEILG